MPCRSPCSTAEQAKVFALPESEEDLLRFYTFDASDMALIQRRRSDANRLGFAMQLAMLRYPGHALGPRTRIPEAVIEWVGGQVGAQASVWARYGVREETRREHFQELCAYLGLTTFGPSDYRFLVRSLTGTAMQTNNTLVLAERALATLRQRGIVAPALSVISRACGEALARASRRIHKALAAPLSERHRALLDGLLRIRPGSHMTWLTWLRQTPSKPTARCMLGHIERLKMLRSLGLPDGTGMVRQGRLRELASKGAQIPAASFAKLQGERRYAMLLAVALERMAAVTDQIVGLHDSILVNLFSSADIKYAEGNPIGFGYLRLVGRHFNTLRGYAPALLDVLELHARPGAGDLLDAIGVLRRLNASNVLKLPSDAPDKFIKPEWRPLMASQAGADRRLYEICVLDELRRALRRGDIWVEGALGSGGCRRRSRPVCADRLASLDMQRGMAGPRWLIPLPAQ